MCKGWVAYIMFQGFYGSDLNYGLVSLLQGDGCGSGSQVSGPGVVSIRWAPPPGGGGSWSEISFFFID